MSLAAACPPPTASAADTKRFFSELLVTMWLRPERALMEAHMMSVLHKSIPEAKGKSLEWGCADGSVTFVALGGRFNFEYDDYLEIECAEKKSAPGAHVDYFDHSSETSVNPVRKTADYIFSNGISWKESHISQTARLGFHQALIAQDFNARLPFPDSYFSFILASNIFWIEKEKDFVNTLGDIARVLDKGGKLLTILPQKIAQEIIVANKLSGAEAKWIERLDRGIGNNLQYNARELQQFEFMAASCGLKITNVIGYCPSLVSTVYQIGFRPMFPVFMNMYGKLKKTSPKKFFEIKKQWIDTVEDFMLPLCESEWMVKMGMPNTWNFFELEKV